MAKRIKPKRTGFVERLIPECTVHFKVTLGEPVIEELHQAFLDQTCVEVTLKAFVASIAVDQGMFQVELVQTGEPVWKK